MKKSLLATSSLVALMAFASSSQATSHELSSIFFKPAQGDLVWSAGASYTDLTESSSGSSNLNQYITAKDIALSYGVSDKLDIQVSGRYNNASDDQNGWSNPSVALSYRAADNEDMVLDWIASYTPDVVDRDSSDFVGNDDNFANIDQPETDTYSLGFKVGKERNGVRHSIGVTYEYAGDYEIASNNYSSENNLTYAYQSQYQIDDAKTFVVSVSYLDRDQRRENSTVVEGGDIFSYGVDLTHEWKENLVSRVGIRKDNYSDVSGATNAADDAEATVLSAGLKFAF